jgi:hypothetical protein
MKLRRFILFLFVLPVTVALDLVLYGITQSCPSCTSFTQWLRTEGALSFPIIVELTEWFQQRIVSRIVEKGEKR